MRQIRKPKKLKGHSIELMVKRWFDIIIASIAFLVLWPLLLVIAVIVRLTSPGPAIFRQSRLGQEGKPFACFKFRTMFMNVPDMRNPDGSTYNADDDPRVTSIGRFLRRTSLDELPQLINVLKGDMSLVGPRPDIVEALTLYQQGDERRLAVKPGITGWAAIHGRNAVPLSRRRALDIEYVESFSLLLDLKILLRTIPYVLLSKGVYTPPPQGNGENDQD